MVNTSVLNANCVLWDSIVWDTEMLNMSVLNAKCVKL